MLSKTYPRSQYCCRLCLLVPPGAFISCSDDLAAQDPGLASYTPADNLQQWLRTQQTWANAITGGIPMLSVWLRPPWCRVPWPSTAKCFLTFWEDPDSWAVTPLMV